MHIWRAISRSVRPAPGTAAGPGSGAPQTSRTASASAARCSRWARSRSVPSMSNSSSTDAEGYVRRATASANAPLTEVRGYEIDARAKNVFGTFQGMRGDRVTIRQLAHLSGVSVGTVSRALNGYADVSPDTRERITRLARELDYTPAAAARSLV